MNYRYATTLMLLCLLLGAAPAQARVDDTDLAGIQRMNEIMQLIRNFYVEEKGVTQLFVGATRGLLKPLANGAKLFTSLQQYQQHIADSRRHVVYGIVLVKHRGWYRVVCKYPFGIFKHLDLRPGDTLYQIGDRYLDNISYEVLVYMLYRSMLREDLPDNAIGVRRQGQDLPIDVPLSVPVDYSCYSTDSATIALLEDKVRNAIGPDVSLLKELALDPSFLVEYRVLNDLHYIRLNALTPQSHHIFTPLLAEANQMGKALVIDLRTAYGYTLEDLKLFLKPFVNRSYFGFYQLKSGKTKKLYVDDPSSGNTLPVILFVSRQTYWYAEFFAQLLKDMGAYVIGESSFGRGDYKQVFSLLDGRYYLYISTGKLFSPRSITCYQKGVKPDRAIQAADFTYSSQEEALFFEVVQKIMPGLIAKQDAA